MIDGLNERLQLFLEDQTYAWIQDIFQFNFNGFIKQIEEFKFLFLDDELGEIWLNKSDVTTISFSKKEKRGENEKVY